MIRVLQEHSGIINSAINIPAQTDHGLFVLIHNIMVTNPFLIPGICYQPTQVSSKRHYSSTRLLSMFIISLGIEMTCCVVNCGQFSGSVFLIPRSVLNYHLTKESESGKACGWFSLALNLKNACLPRELNINSSIFKIKLSLDKHHTFYIRHSIWKRMDIGSNSELFKIFFLICANVNLSIDYHLSYLLQICCSWGWDNAFIISNSPLF